MKLKPGHGVRTSELTEDNFRPVIREFQKNGCLSSITAGPDAMRFHRFLKWHVTGWLLISDFCESDMILSVAQILSEDKEKKQSENGWYERGELPPVGATCKVYRGDFVECDNALITYQGEGVGCYIDLNWDREFSVSHNEYCFRPIKSDREKAIEEMIKLAYTPEIINNRTIMGALYDAGYRKVEQ